MTKVQRTAFKSPRAAEYVDARKLQAMTGQPVSNFTTVALKELVDNALDACETAEVAPGIGIEVDQEPGVIRLAVSDNGGGIPPEVVRGAADYDVTISDKAAYRSPTRGAQGNALQTVLSIPPALGILEPVVMDAQGVRHEVRVWVEPSGELRVQHDEMRVATDGITNGIGTRVLVAIPAEGQDFDPDYWAKAFAVFNPHAAVRISYFESSDLGESKVLDFEDFYPPTRDPSKRFKYVPGNPTSAHWYDAAALERLVFSHIAHVRNGGHDLPLRAFVRQFKGLTAKAKIKAICDSMGGIKTLSDFENQPNGAIPHLLREMRTHSDAPSHATLGTVGKEHFEQRFEEFYGDVYRFGYKKIKGHLASGLPYVFEFALAEVDDEGRLFAGVNFSPTFADPLSDVFFRGGEYTSMGVENFLYEGFVHPVHCRHQDPDPPWTAAAMHIITPAPLFLDRGKTRLEGFSHPDVGGEIARAMFSLIKPYYKEGKRRVKNRTARERAPKKHATAAMRSDDQTRSGALVEPRLAANEGIFQQAGKLRDDIREFTGWAGPTTRRDYLDRKLSNML